MSRSMMSSLSTSSPLPNSNVDRLERAYSRKMEDETATVDAVGLPSQPRPIFSYRIPLQPLKSCIPEERIPPSSPTHSQKSGITNYEEEDSWQADIMDFENDGRSSMNATSIMESSTGSLRTTLRNIQDCRLSLVHIPLETYLHFVQPIVTLILDNTSEHQRNARQEAEDDIRNDDGTARTNGHTGRTKWTQQFVNISVTPIECSIVCSKESAQCLFQPIKDTLDASIRNSVVISEDDFMVIQVEGDSLDAGRRVLNLTSPLALVGVPIFFITTYFSDYILVPSRSRSHVTKALQKRGFVFEKQDDGFTPGAKRHSSTSSLTSLILPPSPPATMSIAQLQTSTFELLKKHNIQPRVSSDAKLCLFAGRQTSSDDPDNALYLGLIKAFVMRSQFLSVTLTESESPSILLDQESRAHFNDGDALLGNPDDILVPIMLDLRDLPLDSTGIVCGVAGRLAGQIGDEVEPENIDDVAVNMSYLSTARAGIVMVSEEDAARTIQALQVD